MTHKVSAKLCVSSLIQALACEQLRRLAPFVAQLQTTTEADIDACGESNQIADPASVPRCIMTAQSRRTARLDVLGDA